MTLAARDTLLSQLVGVSWPSSPLLDALKLPSGADVLDVGAGHGGLLADLRERGHTGRLVGLDPEPGDGIVQGQAEALPFPSDAFDVVLMVRMLSHVQDKAKALAEARRVLRAGGRLVLASNGRVHLQSTWAALDQPLCGTGPDAELLRALQRSDLTAERLDIRQFVSVRQADALQIVHTYKLDANLQAARFPVQDTLQLVVYVHEK